MNKPEKVFADGFSFKRRENAPDFVVGNLSCKVEEACSFLKSHARNGWVNMNIMQSQGGNYYVEKDQFVPQPQGDKPEVKEEVKKAEGKTELPF